MQWSDQGIWSNLNVISICKLISYMIHCIELIGQR